MIRVLVADHQPLIRKGLKYVLLQESDFAPPAGAADCKEALRRLREQDWDAIVVSLARDAWEMLAEIHELRPHLPVLVVGPSGHHVNAARAIASGAAGYLAESDAVTEIPHAIRRIIAGKKYVSPSAAEALAAAAQHGASGTPHEDLSHRELQVMCRIAEGKTVSQIATDLARSVKTVSTYRARALEKMNMTTNAEFIKYALRCGLVE